MHQDNEEIALSYSPIFFPYPPKCLFLFKSLISIYIKVLILILFVAKSNRILITFPPHPGFFRQLFIFPWINNHFIIKLAKYSMWFNAFMILHRIHCHTPCSITSSPALLDLSTFLVPSGLDAVSSCSPPRVFLCFSWIEARFSWIQILPIICSVILLVHTFHWRLRTDYIEGKLPKSAHNCAFIVLGTQ